jgi:hypothetical protein
MPFNVYDSYTLTETVNRSVQTALEGEAYIGDQFMPLVPVRDRKIKRAMTQVAAVGMANFKAPHATPTIFIPQIQFDEEYISLVDMDEMSPITEDEWEKLTGENEFEKLRVGADILQRQRFIQLRFEARTEWMRWQAAKGTLRAQMADNANQFVDVRYGVPTANNVAVSPSWASRATSTPTANIRAAQKYLFQTLGVWGSRIFMGPDTYENWQYSTEVKNLLKPNSGGSDFIIPTVDQLESLLYGGVNGPDRPRPGMPRPTVYVTSAGFRAQNAFTFGTQDMTYFLPEGQVLVLPGQQVNGEQIADMPDGRVLMRPTPESEPTWRQGSSTETLISTMPPYTQYVRQACVRIPRVKVPAAFYWLTV